MKITKFLIIIITAVTLLACSFTVNLPSIKTGVTQTFDINESAGVDSDISKIDIEMGAGTLELTGGTTKLVEGQIIYNVETWKPTVTRLGNDISIVQKNTANVSLPEGTVKNDWKLSLGNMPLELNLSTGAYDGNLDLSGLSLTNLTISDGASRSRIRFDTPNPVEMSLLSYKTGASDITLTGLGNANVNDIIFEGGVGNYELDFSGELTRDMNVSIKSGMSNIKLIFPSSQHVRIAITGGLSNVDINGTWTVRNNVYELGSSGPVIYVDIEMAVGNLQLITQ